MSEKVKLTLRIDKELKKEVQIKCIKEEVSLTQLITQLLQEYVKKE